ncbi:hypothetical protein WAI453_012606 [Rhynchosporium graminicola]
MQEKIVDAWEVQLRHSKLRWRRDGCDIRLIHHRIRADKPMTGRSREPHNKIGKVHVLLDSLVCDIGLLLMILAVENMRFDSGDCS